MINHAPNKLYNSINPQIEIDCHSKETREIIFFIFTDKESGCENLLVNFIELPCAENKVTYIALQGKVISSEILTKEDKPSAERWYKKLKNWFK